MRGRGRRRGIGGVDCGVVRDGGVSADDAAAAAVGADSFDAAEADEAADLFRECFEISIDVSGLSNSKFASPPLDCTSFAYCLAMVLSDPGDTDMDFSLLYARFGSRASAVGEFITKGHSVGNGFASEA